MAPRLPPLGLVLPKVVASVSVLLLVAGSVLVFMVPPPSRQPVEDIEPTPSATPLPDPRVSHDLIFPKPSTSASPSRVPTHVPTPAKTQKSTPKPSPSPTESRRPVPSSPTPDPIHSATPRPVVIPTPTPTPAPTTLKPSPAQTPVPVDDESERRAQVIYLINQQRAQAGIQQLSSSSRLSDHCQEWATELAGTGTVKYSSASHEVIATGTTLPATALQQWLGDQYDSDILFNPAHSRVGAGYVNGYWVVQFG